MELAQGTRVLVTGASRGIGAALAKAFAERGCELCLVARGEFDSGGHRTFSADVADPAAIAAAVEAFGDVDVLVANAGITHYRPFAEQPLAEVEEMTRINWLGTLYTVHAALPRMIERGRGHVVIVSSGAGLRAFPGAAVYGGTKAAQRAFAGALRHELAGTGVSVTTVYPGEIETSLHDHEMDRMPPWYRLDRRSPPEPLAKLVVDAVERDRAEVFYPPNVRLLRIVHGIRPRLSDTLLRRIMHPSAAPRRR